MVIGEEKNCEGWEHTEEFKVEILEPKSTGSAVENPFGILVDLVGAEIIKVDDDFSREVDACRNIYCLRVR